MSNTSDLTPYDSTTSTSVSGSSGSGAGLALGIAAACAAGAVLGTVALVKWLCEETPEDRAAVERMREERRSERLSNAMAMRDLSGQRERLPAITSTSLNVRKLEPLVRTAERLGYKVEPLVQPTRTLAEQPQVMLRSAAGERLVIERNPKGRLQISTAGDAQRIRTLVRQHTVDRTLEHFSRQGMEVRTANLPSGEVQVLARERNVGQRDGAAEIRAQVRQDGSTWVDVDKVRGSRCQEIVSGLAQAQGAEVSGTRKKDAYYQLPGEPARTRVSV